MNVRSNRKPNELEARGRAARHARLRGDLRSMKRRKVTKERGKK